MQPTQSSAVRQMLRLHFLAVLLFLLLPLIIIVPISFTDSRLMSFPPSGFSLRWYRNFFADRGYLAATWVSFQVAVGATIAGTTIGTLAALALRRPQLPGRTLVLGLIIAPMVVPIIIIALAVFIVFAQWRVLESIPALIVAHTVLVIPYSCLIVLASLQHFDETLERAARVLGAGPLRAFGNVTFPFIRPAVVASAVFGFFVSFDELPIALFVTGRIDTLPKRIWSDLHLEIDPTITAVAFLLILLTIAGLSVGEVFRRRSIRDETE
jgi:ABC-type spermidine/putrescine transport system permease subunit II